MCGEWSEAASVDPSPKQLLPGRTRRRTAVVVGIVVVALALCGALIIRERWGSAVGPLGISRESGRLCMPDPTGVPRLDGLTTLQNLSSVPVTVDRVWFRKPRHLRILEASVVEIGLNGVGVGAPYPPTGSWIVPGWATRHPIHGAVLEPRARLPKDHSYEIVLAVQRDPGFIGTADGVSIAYHDGNGSYVFDGYYSRIVTNAKDCFSIESTTPPG
jgi:hypothetical protein